MIFLISIAIVLVAIVLFLNIVVPLYIGLLALVGWAERPTLNLLAKLPKPPLMRTSWLERVATWRLF